MNISPSRLRDIATTLAAIAAELAEDPVPPAIPEDEDAPFGRTLDGKPRFSPAYDAARSMITVAEREAGFNIHALLGGGIKQGAAQIHEAFKPDLRLVEDTVIALARSPWGRSWCANDANLATVGSRDYQRLFTAGVQAEMPNGYYVTRRDPHDESRGYERHAG